MLMEPSAGSTFLSQDFRRYIEGLWYLERDHIPADMQDVHMVTSVFAIHVPINALRLSLP